MKYHIFHWRYKNKELIEDLKSQGFEIEYVDEKPYVELTGDQIVDLTNTYEVMIRKYDDGQGIYFDDKGKFFRQMG
jgi:hypothetical protein